MNQDSASKIVPDQVVEAAWLEIGELSEDQARLHMQRLSRRQSALLAFVTTFSEDLSKDAAELAVYMFVAIVQMFEMHFGKRLQNVGLKRIESIHDENMKMFDRLTGAHERWLERAAVVQSEEQPWVWKYVVECLFEPDDPELKPSEEDQGSLALIMKTVKHISRCVRPLPAPNRQRQRPEKAWNLKLARAGVIGSRVSLNTSRSQA